MENGGAGDDDYGFLAMIVMCVFAGGRGEAVCI